MNGFKGRSGRRRFCALFAALATAILSPSHVGAAVSSQFPAWTRPIKPFRIVGNVYYVGTEGLAAYLIVSPQGDVLLDGALAEDAPLIERSIEKLGFRITDVKVLINSHAHSDHAGGLARLKHDSGARLWASDGDRWALEHGRHRGDDDYGGGSFPPVRVDRVVRDGETIRLGDIALTAVLTPGHTPGCTTWTLPAREGDRHLHVVFPSCFTVAGNILVGNRAYPAIASDYRASFARLKALQADVVLPAHPEFADVLDREKRRRVGDADAFVDRGQLQRIVEAARRAFERELSKQADRTTPSRP
jgi:metallo-beta-lactamase class B